MNTSGMPQSLWTICKKHYARSIHFLYHLLIEPRARTEDEHRHEFILNILLVGSIGITALLDLSLIGTRFAVGPSYRGINITVFTGIVGFFIILLVLSRKGYARYASYLLVALYFIAATYCIHRWGIELPLAAFGYVFTIIISSILINTRFAFITTVLVMCTVILFGTFEITHYSNVNLYWKTEPVRINDAFELSVTLLLIMTVSWLSNREIERSLRRARKSEHELRIERDNLEIKVEERTRELKESQQARIDQLQRFAQFGKMSSGIFHDLMNPLTALIHSVEALDRDPSNLPLVREYTGRAVSSSKRMGEFLTKVRKQIGNTHLSKEFSPAKEVQEAIDILQYRSREAHVPIHATLSQDTVLYGNPVRFHQIALNLIANAIDACEQEATDPSVEVHLYRNTTSMVLSVHDTGCGIDASIMKHIFEEFFTTKGTKGTGLGLSTIKAIIEEDFGGTITFTNNPDRGVTFTVTIPLEHHEQKTGAYN